MPQRKNLLKCLQNNGPNPFLNVKPKQMKRHTEKYIEQAPKVTALPNIHRRGYQKHNTKETLDKTINFAVDKYWSVCNPIEPIA